MVGDSSVNAWTTNSNNRGVLVLGGFKRFGAVQFQDRRSYFGAKDQGTRSRESFSDTLSRSMQSIIIEARLELMVFAR
jgi:hypothetical protein